MTKRASGGDVNIKSFGTNPAYEMGANQFGHAVFKNPDQAFEQMKIDYAEGLQTIQVEYAIKPINKHNFKIYKQFGSQVASTDEEIEKRCMMMTDFINIYENSFSTE